MSLQVELLEKSMAKLTIEVSKEDFDKAIDKAYQKKKGQIRIQGFRPGKAPRTVIEKMYGPEIFFEDAANIAIPDAYEKEVAECDVDIVSDPEIDITQIEKGKPFVFTATVAVKPEVTLGQYKGIEVDKADVDVTDEEVDAEIEKTREQNARIVPVTDRAAQLKDTAVIDFEGFVDDEAFEGGKGTDYPLELGSHSFIDGFEDQIVGKNIGEEFDVNVTFPEEYQAEELAGKPAVFKVTIKELKGKELPELDDEFAQDVSEFETLDEYKADVKKTIAERKESAAKTEKEDKVIEAIIENATMEIPEAMHQTQVKRMEQDFARRVQAQGIPYEQYLKFTGTDRAAFVETIKPQAMKRIKSRLVLEAIVDAENIEVTDEEFNKEVEDFAKTSNMSVDKVKELLDSEKDKKMFTLDIAVQKAMDFIVEQAVEK